MILGLRVFVLPSLRSFTAICALAFGLVQVVQLDAAPKPKPQPLSISTTSLPAGTVGSAYSATLAASGGTSPYTWSITKGSLPAGLSFSNSGVVSGTPSTAVNAQSLTFKVTDSTHPAQNKSATFSLTISPRPLSVTTTSLPGGQTGTAYSANLAASGGTPPYKWSQTGGTLPTGLSLSTSGSITGTPAAAGTSSGLTFSVSDSSSPALSNQSGSLSIVISSGPSGTVSISPRRAGLTTTQSLSLTATSSDGGNLNWSVTGPGCSAASCGTFSSPSTQSGSPDTYTAPATPGQFVITATSATDASISSSITVGVSDLAGVATYHNNISRNGVNSQEYALSPTSLAAGTFGKLFSCPVDGAIYAQPLWVPNLIVGGAQHNVVFVATQHDSLYAFDADVAPCVTLWHVSLIDAAHGGTTGETQVGSTVMSLSSDIQPEVGVTGTPAIDLAAKSLYVVSKSVDPTGTVHYQRLHSIDILTGSEKASGPVLISGTYPATGSAVTFDPRYQNQRPGLALVGGVVYIAWGSHGDAGPWYGWVMGYDATTLNHLYTFNSTPDSSEGGIWMGGGAPSADSSGNLYVITGNGSFDVTSSNPPNKDYGDSFLKLSSDLSVSQYFTPADQDTDNSTDQDFGSGGTSVVLDLPPNGTLPNHLVIGGGKDGDLCLLNRDALGGYSSTNRGAVQVLTFGSGIFGTPAFWNWSFYLAGTDGKLQQFTLNSSTYHIDASPASTSATTYGFPGATPSISAMPDGSGAIVWALDNSQYCTGQALGCGPAVLHAYDATNLGTELFNSSQVSGNAPGLAVKFTVPTVANGKVYVGTRGDDSEQVGHTTTRPGELDVYGLLPN